MRDLFTTRIGLLRVLTFLEGISLIVLVFIAVPIKYLGDDPSYVKMIGPIHGALFLGFLYLAWDVGQRVGWTWSSVGWKILLASFIPFGTFYFDYTILRHVQMDA